jgi:hypothetical protein
MVPQACLRLSIGREPLFATIINAIVSRMIILAAPTDWLVVGATRFERANHYPSGNSLHR